MMMYFSNPPRGCGRKKPGGFYAESEFSSTGSLSVWTWLLGDGLEGGWNCLVAIPPRRPLYGNLATSLTAGEFVPAEGGDALALFDHVGANFYSPYSFASEVQRYGPSRRLSPTMAQELAKKTPIPAVYTHSAMPLFRDEEERAEAWAIAQDLAGAVAPREPQMRATWLNPDWGIFAADEDRGYGHYLTAVLWVLDRLQRDWRAVSGDVAYREAKDFFDSVNFVEQPFGVSWLTKVSYVLKPEDNKDITFGEMARKGINVLDLEEAQHEPA